MSVNRSKAQSAKPAVIVTIKVAAARKAGWPKLALGDRLTVIGIGGVSGRDTDYMVLPDRATDNLPFFGGTADKGNHAE